MGHPEIGSTFIAEIDRVSSSGNGMIELESGPINIGPVVSNSVGETIKGLIISDWFAICFTDSVKDESYYSRYKNLLKYYSEDTIGEFYQENIYIMTENWDPSNLTDVKAIVKSENQRSDPRDTPTIKIQDTDVHIRDAEVGEILKVEIWCHSGFFAIADVISRFPELMDESARNSVGPLSTDNPETDAEQSNNENLKPPQSVSESESSRRKTDGTTDINFLREKAKENAVEEVSKNITTTTQQSKPQYNRSQAVKDYVKARAEGRCESCGDPAPFTSKTGEPYLHAHHIHELSDSGSDTPDTVIALCPNCHYRVHHGKDGEEYNQELREIVQEKEDKLES